MSIWHRKGHSTRIPPRARTIRLRGQDDDAGRYFRCWHCGFICDKERDALGGPNDRHGMGAEFYYETYPQSMGNSTRDLFSTFQIYEEGENEGVARATMCRIRELEHRVMELDGEGNEKEIRLTYLPVVKRGCPGCGSLNWRGDHR